MIDRPKIGITTSPRRGDKYYVPYRRAVIAAGAEAVDIVPGTPACTLATCSPCPKAASVSWSKMASRSGFLPNDFFFSRLQRGAHGSHDRVRHIRVGVDREAAKIQSRHVRI